MPSRKSKKAQGYLPSPNDAGIQPCPFNQEEFLQRARQVKVTMEYAGQVLTFYLRPKVFSTGSYGFINEKTEEKVQFNIDGAPAIFQNNLILTLVGSRKMKAWEEWKREQEEKENGDNREDS